jgi:hypothetical protein
VRRDAGRSTGRPDKAHTNGRCPGGSHGANDAHRAAVPGSIRTSGQRNAARGARRAASQDDAAARIGCVRRDAGRIIGHPDKAHTNARSPGGSHGANDALRAAVPGFIRTSGQRNAARRAAAQDDAAARAQHRGDRRACGAQRLRPPARKLPLIRPYFLFGFFAPLCNAKSVWLCDYPVNFCVSSRVLSLSLSCRVDEVKGLFNEKREERSLEGIPVRSVRFFQLSPYRGTSLIRRKKNLVPYRRPMPRVLEGS